MRQEVLSASRSASSPHDLRSYLPVRRSHRRVTHVVIRLSQRQQDHAKPTDRSLSISYAGVTILYMLR